MRGLPLHTLAWAAALLPFATTHISYVVAASGGHVDWCVPYWDSCSSISAAGRQLPEKILFKLGMFPAAMITALLWWSLWRWFDSTPARDRRVSCHSMLTLGVLAACFLMLYTAVLGEIGDNYQRLRRTGVTLAFAFTYLAQLLCTRLLFSVDTAAAKRLAGLLVLLLAIGITSVILDAWLGQGYDTMEDGFEWTMALLLNAWFAGVAVLLSRRELQLDITPCL